MNNNFVKFAFIGIACAAFCTTTIAAPKGGRPGGNHGGNGGRPARAERQTHANHAAPERQTRANRVARPAAKPSPGKHAAPANHAHKPTVARKGHARPEPGHHAPPPRAGRRYVPSHAHYCVRPAVPLWRAGALRAWEWIEEEWMIIVNGVCYYGDGYYYDGYNYYYNGAYHTAPPISMFI